mmetsp:Transcript_16006/g.34669  ORF Transcript_16006/g.34669 Transcript_16006/m.34669 type:complete len:208 (-) Transcript_16006:982-1605(-)
MTRTRTVAFRITIATRTTRTRATATASTPPATPAFGSRHRRERRAPPRATWRRLCTRAARSINTSTRPGFGAAATVPWTGVPLRWIRPVPRPWGGDRGWDRRHRCRCPRQRQRPRREPPLGTGGSTSGSDTARQNERRNRRNRCRRLRRRRHPPAATGEARRHPVLPIPTRPFLSRKVLPRSLTRTTRRTPARTGTANQRRPRTTSS